MSMNRLKNKLLAAIAAGLLLGLMLGGCLGGGGSSSVSVINPAPEVEGIWKGSTSSGRVATAIILNDGSFWFLYSAQDKSNILAGAIQGISTSTNGNFNAANAKDFNLEGSALGTAVISGSYFIKQSLSGNINFPSLNQNDSFTTVFSGDYALAPSLAAIAGTYSGTGAVIGDAEAFTLTFSPVGTIAGLGSGGCGFSGTLVPNMHGNVYDMTVTFAGGTCTLGTETVTGTIYFDAVSRRLLGATLDAAHSNGFFYSGVKLSI